MGALPNGVPVFQSPTQDHWIKQHSILQWRKILDISSRLSIIFSRNRCAHFRWRTAARSCCGTAAHIGMYGAYGGYTRRVHRDARRMHRDAPRCPQLCTLACIGKQGRCIGKHDACIGVHRGVEECEHRHTPGSTAGASGSTTRASGCTGVSTNVNTGMHREARPVHREARRVHRGAPSVRNREVGPDPHPGSRQSATVACTRRPSGFQPPNNG